MAWVRCCGGSKKKTVFDAFREECNIYNVRPSGWSGNTFNTASILDKTGNTVRIYDTGGSHGNITTVMDVIGIDVTDLTTITFDITMTMTNGSIYMGVADNTSDLFSSTNYYINGMTFNNERRAFTVNVSGLTGVKYLFLSQYCSGFPYSITINNITVA